MLSPEEWSVIELSLRVALIAMLWTLPVAVGLAWLLARRDFFGKSLLDALVHLPLVLPPVVLGYGLLVLLGRKGPIGAWLNDWFGITLAFTWQGAAIAAGVAGLPLAVRAIRLSLDAVDRRLEQAARSLGAGKLRVFATITLPLALPGVLAGAILSFARGLGEFGATITFVADIPGETRTLSLAVHTLLQVPGGEAAAIRLSMISIVLAFLALMGSEYLNRRLAKRLGTRP
ncbi:MAG: molybdate ABC transporter permease subunit [Rhodospirillales bacterium]